jgi:hypothetical protein
LTFVVGLYLSRVIISIILMLIIRLCKNDVWNKRLQSWYNFTSSGIFFNQIIRLSFEAYFEFYLIGMMNLQTAEYNLSGEFLGISLSYFVLSMILFVMPTLSILIVAIR